MHASRMKKTGTLERRSQVWNLDPIKKRMFHNAKKRAVAKGLEFLLQAKDVEIPEVCPVLGVKLEAGKGKFCDASPSLDRINPSLGYVPGNVRVICWRANRIKNNATAEELGKILRYMQNEQAVE